MNHTFYLSLAYGVGAVLLLLEIILLRRRYRRARKLQQGEQV
ncbi:MAG: heme exporter protein CcmD [Burkholderiaceae bacterium]|nr:heme exporter protein CcmD [Herminiimonas contaminans]MBX9800279.1 heme exporter protein CcmD [Burkholderiaceae bacterium]